MAKKATPTVDVELRCKGGSPLVYAATLPLSTSFPAALAAIEWEAPVVTDRQPALELEMYHDGKLIGEGTWPNLQPV